MDNIVLYIIAGGISIFLCIMYVAKYILLLDEEEKKEEQKDNKKEDS